MSDTLSKVGQEINQRLKQLKPVVEEYQRLEGALDGLSGVPRRSGNSSRRRGGNQSGATRRKSQRPAGSRSRVSPEEAEKRREQIVAILREDSSVRPAALATRLGISRQNVHQDLRKLRAAKRLRKTTSGYQPV